MRPFSSSQPAGGFIRAATAICGLLSLIKPTMAEEKKEKSAADYFVHSLPGAPEGPLLKMHAGWVEVNPAHNANLFFWHFQNRHIAQRQRTVVWLNGGPGCSSEDGALMEIGPYRLKDKATLQYNEGGWDEFANLLFVDNPVGTGFSRVDGDAYVHDLETMAEHMVKFLEKWFGMFPHFEHDDLYFSGESYAGQHIPYIARAILERNKKAPSNKQWNLKGLLIGNGWISPKDQYPAYLPFALREGIISAGSNAAAQVEAAHAECAAALAIRSNLAKIDVPACEKILRTIIESTKHRKDGVDVCTNMYDIRLTDTYPSCGMNWPPDLKDVEPYLRRPDVLSALNIAEPAQPGWVECNGPVGLAFRTQTRPPSIQLFPELLKEIPILLFSGAMDLICNHLGTEDMINSLTWSGGTGFEISPGTWAPRHEWSFEGQPAGFYQEARNLTYVLFANSSHMVPFDYARRTRDMLDRFIGVDIADIGGKPGDSRLDGQKGVETSVGGHPNSTVAEEEQAAKLVQAKWDAYYKSGQVALIVVIIVAGVWGWFIWRERRKRRGYKGMFGGWADSTDRLRAGMGLPVGHKRDVEAADFDEAELDDLAGGRDGRYDVGSDSEEDGDVGKQVNGTGKGKEPERY